MSIKNNHIHAILVTKLLYFSVKSQRFHLCYLISNQIKE